MMRRTADLILVLVAAFCAMPADGSEADSAAIREVIEQRRVAWNAEDSDTYAKLLTSDADIVSATGRAAYGRDEVLRLYQEQRAGAYRGATVLSMVVTRIKFVRPDVAVVDAEFEIEGVRGQDGKTIPLVTGLNNFLVVKENGRWLISSIRGIPKSTIQAPRQ